MLDAFSTFYPEVPGDHVDQTKLAFPVTMFRPICKSRGVFLLGQTVRYPPTEIWQSSSIFTFVSEDPGTWRKVGSCTKSRRKSVAAITCKRQIRLSFWCDTQTQTITLVLLATLVLVNSPRRIHYLSFHLLGGEECLPIFNSTGNACCPCKSDVGQNPDAYLWCTPKTQSLSKKRPKTHINISHWDVDVVKTTENGKTRMTSKLNIFVELPAWILWKAVFVGVHTENDKEVFIQICRNNTLYWVNIQEEKTAF